VLAAQDSSVTIPVTKASKMRMLTDVKMQ